MPQTGLAQFDNTLQTTNTWLKELMRELRSSERQHAYHALRVPPAKRSTEAFMGRIADAFRDRPDVAPEDVGRAVFAVLAKHVTMGEVNDIKRSLPEDIRLLWP
ncbi:MAG: DUF2267 domain-containing protein [Planctomycetes bacterium]|nr:DUF2267 domain-containing protein [Planctomycetota bacterium]